MDSVGDQGHVVEDMSERVGDGTFGLELKNDVDSSQGGLSELGGEVGVCLVDDDNVADENLQSLWVGAE